MPYRQAGFGGGCVTEIPAGVVVAFDDPDAVPALLALGIAELSKEAPARVFTQAEVDFDPRTVFGPGFGSRHGMFVIKNSQKPSWPYEAGFEVAAG